jgi:hypothetical protein
MEKPERDQKDWEQSTFDIYTEFKYLSQDHENAIVKIQALESEVTALKKVVERLNGSA